MSTFAVGGVDYADLRRHGTTRVREGTLFPEETGMRHVTMYQVGDDEQWRILFDTLGNEKLIDGEPGLGTVFTSPDGNAPPLEKLGARIDQPWFIDVDHLVRVLATAIERFLVSVPADWQKLELVSNRIRESYFSSGVLKGAPMDGNGA